MKLKVLFLPLSIVLSLIIIIWMAKPQYDQWQSEKEVLSTEQEKLDKIDSQIASLENALKQYESVSADKQLIENAIPLSATYDDSIAEIYQKIKDAGVLLQDISVSSEVSPCQAEAGIGTDALAQDAANTAIASMETGGETPILGLGECLGIQNFSIIVEGSYPQVKSFLDLLNRTNRYTELESIQLDKSDPEDSTDQVIANVYFTTFSKQNKAGINDQTLATPVGQILLQGMIEVDVIEMYKAQVTNRSFVPLPIENFGKSNLFSNSAAASATLAVPETNVTTSLPTNNTSIITDNGSTTNTQ